MKYNNNWTKEQFNSNPNTEFLFFWGHQPPPPGQMNKSCLSQWFERPFTFENIQYPTAEHWMMAEKARLFNDYDILLDIINSSSPQEAKKLGRKVRGFDDWQWQENREQIVQRGNYLKFSQHQDLCIFLDNTKDKIIVEASPYDSIWGVGMQATDKNIINPNNWTGLNLLGYALMEVRDRIRQLEAENTL